MDQQTTAIDGYAQLIGQRIVRQLALEWIQSKLPNEELTFVDCLNVLNHVQVITQDSRQTEIIFEQLFEQACRLNKSSAWFAQELQFEALVLTARNRLELARLYLTQSQPVDDAALDTYLERLSRRIEDSPLILSM
ncbi:hypothetical protein [Spirosoma pollinicola]|uniref:Uncharacterized protein n=1 Tax=Spirosoma pollinicola TaxID=2057025 RepID=A0A2K8Z8G2_9BACT|nr:hypothetical protein [Spirosoma pollinicola]AUD06163.1 hypothetical protein CWM47_32555 [Spirosoma pollinicola]